MIDDAQLKRWTEQARRDDWHMTFVGSDIRVMLGEITRMREWRPIDTAPMDGTRILVNFGRVGVHAVAWEESVAGTKIWCVDDLKHGPYPLRKYVDMDIVGWLPLPAQTAGMNGAVEPPGMRPDPSAPPDGYAHADAAAHASRERGK